MALIFGVQFFIWVGTMRMSIYGTLSSISIFRLWAMIRKNPSGLFKIFSANSLLRPLSDSSSPIVWCVVLFVVGVFVSMLVMGAIDYIGVTGLLLGA